MGQLQGKIALVTGGTRGIGLAIVKAFIEEGASVALCGSRPETAEKALAELKAAYPTADLMALSPDLALHSEVEEAVAAVKAHYGRIDILVNNAGVSARESLYNYETEAFDRVMDLNVNAIFYTSRAVAPIMKAYTAPSFWVNRKSLRFQSVLSSRKPSIFTRVSPSPNTRQGRVA